MSVLWNSEEAAAASGGEAGGAWQAGGVSIDTRSLAPGDLFIALTGPNHDGHDFVAEAFARGAAAAMVSRAPDGAGIGPLLRVQDTQRALVDLGRAARGRAPSLQVVGVTGSVGKTGTKNMIAAALTPSGKVVHSARSLNNEIGVPLTLARIPSDARYAVVEMGTSAAGEIAAHTALVRPGIALVTAIAPAHMESFGTLESVARAKSEIFLGLEADGVAIVPAAGPGHEILFQRAQESAAAQVLRFGGDGEADAVALRVCVGADATAVQARICGREVAYRIGAPGRHLANNSLAALLAVGAAGADLARGCCALAAWTAPDGRGTRERIHLSRGGSFVLVDDSYNANPTSMEAALEGLAAQPSDSGNGRRIAFLGDMLELGSEEDRYHAGLAGLDAMQNIDLVYACGPRMRRLYEALPIARRGGWDACAGQLAARAPQLVRAGDVAMVKGSNGARVFKVAAALRGAGSVGG